MTKQTIVTKAPTGPRKVKAVNLPITSLRELRTALSRLLATDGKGGGEGASGWSLSAPIMMTGASNRLLVAVPPKGTRMATLTALAQKLGGTVAPVKRFPSITATAQNAIVIALVPGGKPPPPIQPMLTVDDVKQTLQYHLLTGNVGCEITGWKTWLAQNRTSVVAAPPKGGATSAQLTRLVGLFGVGHVDPLIQVRGEQGPRRPAIVVEVPWTDP